MTSRTRLAALCALLASCSEDPVGEDSPAGSQLPICTAGDTLRWSEGKWACARPASSSLTAGEGLVREPTATGEALAVDPAVVQRRVSSPCEPGEAIRGIGEDGSVACESVGAAGLVVGAGLEGDGTDAAPLGVRFGTGAGDVAPGNHVHSFASLADVPAGVLPLLPGGATGSIVQSVRVRARADCGNAVEPPRLEVHVNGMLVATSNVTSATFADTAELPVTPAMQASEIAVALANPGIVNNCRRRLYVESITVATPLGNTTVPANDPARVIFDRGEGLFDGIDVSGPVTSIEERAALRFVGSAGAPREQRLHASTRGFPAATDTSTTFVGLSGRQVTYRKKLANSALRVTFNDLIAEPRPLGHSAAPTG